MSGAGAEGATVLDFDAFRREQEGTPKILRVGGHEYALPASLPALLALDVIRVQRDYGADGAPREVPIEELEPIATGIFGDQLRRILSENRIGLDELGPLISQVVAMYTGDATPPPNRAIRRLPKRPSRSTSSSPGRSSRPTSRGNTGSISATR